ncbi:MAG: PD-(D/E)XK nuclease family protein [Clostridia bacterium]|nr:PD-(D/E)XK nuclease family protein [Clostridia bacterium]
MIKCVTCPALSVALDELKKIISANEKDGKKTVIFCEDRLTLAAERTVCSAVGGTFNVSVYTFARFLSSERGKRDDVLSSQGSAMVIRAIIESNKNKLKLFGKFSASAAAGAVYDTIALLYSSRITAEDVARAAADGLLESKLHDIAVIYDAYEEYLKEHGKTDKNAYLGELPEVIRGSAQIAQSDVVFLGFQSFTRSALGCVRAVFGCAKNTYGLFIGGKEDIYVNEAEAAFTFEAKAFGGADCESAQSTLIPEAEALRKSIFDPSSFYSGNKLNTSNVHIFEAEDTEEELEYIAASIKKHVLDCGERYAKISVMLPDISKSERDIDRIFSQYRIPYYADRRHSLSEHFVCAFITDYLSCVVTGCSFKHMEGVICSPFFPADKKDRDMFRNYALRLASFRGGIKREPDRDITVSAGYDYDAVQRVRKTFLEGLELLPNKSNTRDICGGIRSLLQYFNVRAKLEELSEKFKDEYPTEAQFSNRVYDALISVIDEAEEVTEGANVPLKEFIKILKSGFGALEISLIPPKADAVFVGDIGGTANTGSNVVFAAGLTGEVPGASSDTALLTDREIAALEKVNIDISPKIRQVNMRRREMIALNICAFKKQLYLSYPVRSGGEESCAGEIINYATAVFRTPNGARLKPLDYKRLKQSGKALPFYCSEKLPALKSLCSDEGTAVASVYEVLKERGFKEQADAVLSKPDRQTISRGRELFVTNGNISPTLLETYFSCPYKNFMMQGLKLTERAEGAMRPLDTGNFIHAVLEKIAPELEKLNTKEEARGRAEQLAREMLNLPQYSSVTDSTGGKYTADALIKEAGTVSSGAFEQIYNSKFKVESTESRCLVTLNCGVNVGGRIDRTDSFGDMVRIIDYKTGNIDDSASAYYMGLKLQLPLYLMSASKGRRAVGAYYFPASVEYKSKADGVFRLQGFMDGSEEVVKSSDKNVQPKEKSAYFNAYLSGRSVDSAMDENAFNDFITYSSLVADKGVSEMLEGNIAPSPVEDICGYCKVGGSCNFAVGIDGAGREARSIKCGEIAAIVARRRGEK